MAVVELLRQHIMDANVAVSALSTLYVPVSLRRVAVVVCLHHSHGVCAPSLCSYVCATNDLVARRMVHEAGLISAIVLALRSLDWSQEVLYPARRSCRPVLGRF